MVAAFCHWPDVPSPTLTANASGDRKPPPPRDLPPPHTAGPGPALRFSARLAREAMETRDIVFSYRPRLKTGLPSPLLGRDPLLF